MLTHVFLVIGSTRTRSWNVSAFTSSVGAYALSDCLNDWCKAHDVDADSRLYSSRDDALSKAVFEQWIAEHGTGGRLHQEGHIASPAEREAFIAKCKADFWLKLGTPAEDPDFRTDDFGTRYVVTALLLHD